MKDFAMSWGLVALCAICDSYAAYVVKYKFNQQGQMDFASVHALASYMWEFVQSPLLLTALITFLAAPGIWFLALNRLDLSVAYPVLVILHLLLVMIIGALLLNESFGLNKAIGTLLIIVSLCFFFGSQSEHPREIRHESHAGTVSR